MKVINYTIIIPHKNIPNLLQRCLDSIPYRNDIQIIIVDDNSDPDIVDFAQFPGLGRPCTEVYFTKEGKGAGYARNVGLRHAKGKWLIFADADDFFMPCINEALDKYKDDENDMIYFKLTSVDSETLEPHFRHNHINNILSNIQKTNNWDKIITLAPVWGKFYKQNIIFHNNIAFQETSVGNDILFTAKISTLNIKRTISNDEIYCITYRHGSITSTTTLETVTTRFQISCNACLYIKQCGKKKYFYEKVLTHWMIVFKTNPFIAFFLFPQLIKTCGFGFAIENIFARLRNKIRKLLNNYTKNV